ncbi:MAG: helix-turn-helix domain-containing protein [Burkholderiaceae bacterium]|nr:helix-turn-helix domain-containing protein [Burkholderiaceae bacterium]
MRKLPTVDTSLTPAVTSLQELGLLVRNARAASMLRIDDAAALSNVSSNLLSRLENGKPVTTDKLLEVLNGLGLRMAVFPVDQPPLFEAATKTRRVPGKASRSKAA